MQAIIIFYNFHLMVLVKLVNNVYVSQCCTAGTLRSPIHSMTQSIANCYYLLYTLVLLVFYKRRAHVQSSSISSGEAFIDYTAQIMQCMFFPLFSEKLPMMDNIWHIVLHSSNTAIIRILKTLKI